MKKFVTLTLLTMLLTACTLIGGLYYLSRQTLPTISIAQTSQILDDKGEVIDFTYQNENRQPVKLSAISPDLVQATIAIEDQRFYDHLGIDLRGLARAVKINVLSKTKKQGASTITQQLARNLYLSQERTWRRKVKEAVYAVQLEMKYSKKEILSLYFNQIYYGHGAYGVEAASQLYFNKSASELSLAESAMLAGIPKGPTYYSPFNNLERATKRQHTILNVMVNQHLITQEQADEAMQQQLTFKPLSVQKNGVAPYFRDYIEQVAVHQLGIDEQVLSEGGVKIYTTLNQLAQQAAEKAVADTMIDGSEQQVALVSVDPRTGYIKAMVGGRDYAASQINHALSQNRQPGSSFKPIVYWTALQDGAMTTTSRFRSEPTVFTYDDGRKTYSPHNYNEKYANAEIDMRRAIASSDNIFAVQTIMHVSPEKVIASARQLGISSPLQAVPSLALGTSPISPLEMASAFSTFASGGIHRQPIAIVKIENNRGDVLYEANRKEERVMTEEQAFIVTNLLQSVFEKGGTAYRVASLIKRPVAGKTGTTATDAWLVGYTPELATAVWTGYDKDVKLTTTEAHLAAPIFATYTEQALADVPPKSFIEPEGVVNVYIDEETGLLATAKCPHKRLEVYEAGSEPKKACPLHGGDDASELDDNEKDTHLDDWWMSVKKWFSAE